MGVQWTRTVVLFLMSINSVSCTLGVECPEGQGCTLCSRSSSGFKIYCEQEETHYSGPHFQVEYRLETDDDDNALFDFLEIKCVNAPKWTDFHLGTGRKMKLASIIIFRECDLPADIQLISVVNQLFDGNNTKGKKLDGIGEFKFNSYGKLRSTLARTIFAGFNNSMAIDLSHNGLQTVPEDLLSDFANLKILNLGFNDLRRISSKFLNLSSLQTLILEGNSILVIEKTTFINVLSLEVLDISENQITEIENHSLDNLKQLRKLNLRGNNLTSLPTSFFQGLKELTDLNLSNNNFTRNSLDNIDFSNNENLQTLELSRNKQNLTTIPLRFLPNMYELEILKLDNNGILELPSELLIQETPKLSLLDISENNIATLPHGIFGRYSDITTKTINLSRNHITDIFDDIFFPYQELGYLDMSHNELTFQEKSDYNFKFFALTVRIIDFSNNKLAFNGFISTKKYGTYLPLYNRINTTEELYLDNNNISTIHRDWLTAERLQVLRLRNNQFTHLSHLHLCFNSKRTVQLDLRDNKIVTIDLSGFESPEFNISRFNHREAYPVASVQLANNPIQCDCSIYHLLRFEEKRMDPSIWFLFEITLEGLTCAGPPELLNVSVTSLNSKLLYCRVPQNSSDNRICPDACDCFYRVEDHAFLINCSYRDFIQATVDFNPGLSWHTEVNLTGNSLKKIPTISPPGSYNNGAVISLSFNQISNLSANDLPKNLTELYLHGNNLTQLHQEDIQYLADSLTLQRLTLHGNPWKCDCDTLGFFYFIQSKQAKFTELQSVTCNASIIPIFKMSSKDFCPPSLAMIVGTSMTAIFLLITAILAAVYYRYQTEIKVWLFAHQLLPWFVNETELDRDKMYDAFISYSHQDEDFVVHTLVSRLEGDPHAFKLCVHYRDWLVGEVIADQIARSVANSRRTIVVLSRNFLQSEWGRMEFRTAHSTALREGRVRLIVIIYGDIGPIDELETELAAYMRTNTYIEWGDRWFWEKLRYALPHSVNQLE